jgi:hypothetical protein
MINWIKEVFEGWTKTDVIRVVFLVIAFFAFIFALATSESNERKRRLTPKAVTVKDEDGKEYKCFVSEVSMQCDFTQEGK